MKELEGVFYNQGCKLPIGVFTQVIGEEIRIIGQVWHPTENLTVRDGKGQLEIRGPLENAIEIGEHLSNRIKEKGGLEILNKLAHN